MAAASVQRLKREVKDRMRELRGRGLQATIDELNRLLRGWASYFRYAEVKNVWQD